MAICRLPLPRTLEEGVLQRQFAEFNGSELANPLFGEIALGSGVDQQAMHQEIALHVGMEDVGAHANFEQARHRRAADPKRRRSP